MPSSPCNWASDATIALARSIRSRSKRPTAPSPSPLSTAHPGDRVTASEVENRDAETAYKRVDAVKDSRPALVAIADKPGVVQTPLNWPSFRGPGTARRGRWAISTAHLGRGQEAACPLENCYPWPGTFVPGSLGGAHLPDHGSQRRRQGGTAARSVWQRRIGAGGLGTYLASLLSGQTHRQNPLGADCLQGRTEGQTPSQSQPC